MKNITQALKVVTLALTLSFGISYVYAWTAPTAKPPGGNVSAPINTSATAQYKEGTIGIGGLIRGYTNAIFDGSVGIGTTNPSSKLHVNGNPQTTNALLRVSTNDDNNGPARNILDWGYVPGVLISNDWDGDAATSNSTKIAKLVLNTASGGYNSGGSIHVEGAGGYDQGQLVFSTGWNSSNNATERMRINASGNVGVGVSNPTQKLDVAGNIKGTGVCIGTDCKTSWPTGGSTPPAGSEFLNTSATAQTKAGGLTVASLNSGGAVTAAGNIQGQHIKFPGVGGNSGAGADYYGIYQESGPWSYPYPDLRVQYHTGIKYDAYQGYGGHQFYTGYDGSGNPAGLQMQITDKVYVSNDVCTTAGKCLSATGGGPDSGTICGWYALNFNLVSNQWGTTYSPCKGYNPGSSCPPGYTQRASWSFGYSHYNSMWCSKD